MSLARVIAAGLLAVGAGCQTVSPTPAPSPHVRTPAPPPTSPIVPAAATEPAGPTQQEFPIDLGTALRLGGVENPTINLAREQVQEALAGQLAAQSLMLPSVNLGGNVRVHRGALITARGIVRDVNSQSAYVGAGAHAIGSGTVAYPGLRIFAPLGDALYEPLAARQIVAARGADAQAMNNTILRDVATAYLELVGAEARLAVLRDAEPEVAEVVRLTAAFAAKGQGRSGDAHRAEANADLLLRDVRRAEEDVAVASARLCRLLNLDPAIRLRTPPGPVEPFRLLAEDTAIEALETTALQNRPEVFARSADIAEAQTRVRQERVRPWVPTVSVGFSGGAFGGGSNLAETEFSTLRGRTDFDVAAVWTLESLGVGNRARVRGATAGVGQAVADFQLAENRIRQEVGTAQADAKAAARQIEAARAAVKVADEGFHLERERIKQGQGYPLELLDSYRQWVESHQELVRAVVAFDVAQFRLFVAIGSNPNATPLPVGDK